MPVKIMEQQDFLESIYQNDWIDSEDRGKVINLYERIKQGMTEPIHMQELSAEIRVKEHSPGKELVRIRLYLDLDEQGLIRAYVGKAKILSRKELEDREILMSFSNDKNPAIFINRIARFMEKIRSGSMHLFSLISGNSVILMRPMAVIREMRS